MLVKIFPHKKFFLALDSHQFERKEGFPPQYSRDRLESLVYCSLLPSTGGAQT